MKVIIAGGRNVQDLDHVIYALKEYGKIHLITQVVSGMARGVDSLAVRWAGWFNIPVMPFPANWDKHGRAAGPIRNLEMAEYADELVAVWDGKSRGTKNMIDQMHHKQKPVFIYRIDQ